MHLSSRTFCCVFSAVLNRINHTYNVPLLYRLFWEHCLESSICICVFFFTIFSHSKMIGFKILSEQILIISFAIRFKATKKCVRKINEMAISISVRHVRRMRVCFNMYINRLIVICSSARRKKKKRPFIVVIKIKFEKKK